MYQVLTKLPCDVCNGAGTFIAEIHPTEERPCFACEGSGQIERWMLIRDVMLKSGLSVQIP